MSCVNDDFDVILSTFKSRAKKQRERDYFFVLRVRFKPITFEKSIKVIRAEATMIKELAFVNCLFNYIELPPRDSNGSYDGVYRKRKAR